MMTKVTPKPKFRVGQIVLHKVRYWTKKGVEKYRWEKVKILQRSLCHPHPETDWWTYRFEAPLMGFFNVFEGEEQFKKIDESENTTKEKPKNDA